MRSNILSLALGLMAPALIGCGDNGTASPDAKQPDGPSGPDADTFKGFDADEGGEVRVEYVRWSMGEAAARATAFGWKPTNPSFYDYLNLQGCTALPQLKQTWPMATNAEADRNYLDLGTVTIKGGPNDLVVNKNTMAGNDPFARSHPANEWYFKGAQPNVTVDAPMYLPEKTAFDVEFGGSADIPAQTFEDAIYMPADFELTVPASHATYPIPPYVLTSGDHTFSWTKPADMAPGNTRIDSLVAFTGAKGPVVICIEPNDGSMTIPKAMIDIARAEYPSGGTLARQTLVHQVRELKDNNGPTGRRIDFIGVWCYATAWIPVAP